MSETEAPSLKRFLLFAGDTYYPCGGWHDFIGSYDSYEEAAANGDIDRNDWWHVIDHKTGLRISKAPS